MKPFRAALCQIEARDLSAAEDTLAEILRMLDEAGAGQADIALLPECSYPAYFLDCVDPYEEPGVRPYAEVLALLAERARRHGMYVAAGLAVPDADGALWNGAILLDREGELAGQYAKSFLWHFDNVWFEPGTDFPTFDTDFGRVGMLVCADGRQPEVARLLALNGAEVILDLTAWVSGGRRLAELTTSQCEYFMPVRARENGVWVLAADKHGAEAGSIIYAGRSSAIGPDGVTRLCGPTDKSEVILFDVQPESAPALPRRRPGLYSDLVQRHDTLPVWERMWEYLIPAVSSARLVVDPTARAANGIGGGFRRQMTQFADLVLYPVQPFSAEDVHSVIQATADTRVTAVIGVGDGRGASQAVMIAHGSVLAQHYASHGEIAAGEAISEVHPTPAGYVGLMVDEEGLVPEVGRALMLRGADIIVWTLSRPEPMLEQFVRARAEENRVFVAAASPTQGLIASPSGALIAVMPEDRPVAMGAQINYAESRSKDRAPGTSVLLGRHPEAYSRLLQP
jgi:predicted amidohydrolase